MRLGAVLAMAMAPLPQAPAPAPADPATSFAAAVAAYRAGRFDEAYAAFAALSAATTAAERSPELLGNLALAALRVHRAGDAASAATVLQERGDAAERGLGTFLLAQADSERARLAEAAARLPDAEPMAWDAAVRAADAAVRGFLLAADLRARAGGGEWPEALRNAERAARTVAALRAARDAAQRPDAQHETPPPPPPPERGEGEQEAVPELAGGTLSAAQLAELLQRVRAREVQKQRARQTAPAPGAVAERDW